MIRTILIDDEQAAIAVLSLVLKKYCADDVVVIATSTQPGEAKLLIEQHQPDLVFMDIEMPGLSGIDIMRNFENPKFRVVFVTAYDAYAVEAFELSAIDYLLKPVGVEKVQRVIGKIKEDLLKQQNRLHAQLKQLETLLNQHASQSNWRIGLSMSDKIIYVSIPDILYLEAQGAYTKVFLSDGRNILTSKSLGDYEDQLPNQHFFRIHHAYVININKVKEFHRNDGAMVLMENGIRLEVSTRKKKDFLSAMDRMIP